MLINLLIKMIFFSLLRIYIVRKLFAFLSCLGCCRRFIVGGEGVKYGCMCLRSMLLLSLWCYRMLASLPCSQTPASPKNPTPTTPSPEPPKSSDAQHEYYSYTYQVTSSVDTYLYTDYIAKMHYQDILIYLYVQLIHVVPLISIISIIMLLMLCDLGQCMGSLILLMLASLRIYRYGRELRGFEA